MFFSIFLTVCWTHITRACVSGHNIGPPETYPNKTLDECKVLCINHTECKSFEYGVPHGSKVQMFKARDCRLQSGSDPSGCDGGALNLDLYVKRDCGMF